MTTYNVLYIDPPWRYSNVRTGGSLTSGADAHYDTLSTAELAALPVGRLADADAVLFLWATVPMLPDAMRVLSAWDFTYKTLVVWGKAHRDEADLFGGTPVRESRLGMGQWLRGQVELLLLGVRGDVKPFRSSQRNVIRVPAGEHSAKPIDARRLIEQATATMPNRRMAELFARERHPGWTSYGHDIDGRDIRQVLADELSETTIRI